MKNLFNLWWESPLILPSFKETVYNPKLMKIPQKPFCQKERKKIHRDGEQEIWILSGNESPTQRCLFTSSNPHQLQRLGTRQANQLEGSGDGSVKLIWWLGENLHFQSMPQNHRIIKVGKIKSLRSLSPTINQAPPCLQRNYYIHFPSQNFQRQLYYHFPKKPVPILDKSLSEEFFPNTKSKLPMVQLKAIFSGPAT